MTYDDNNMDQTAVDSQNGHRSGLISFLMERATFVSLIIGALLVVVLLSYHSVGEAAQMPAKPSNEESNVTVRTVESSAPAFDPQADARAYERDRQMQLELEAKREQEFKDRQAASVKMEQARGDQQYFGQSQWSEVIYNNLETFRALRAAAAESGRQTVTCSICAGKSHMETCFLCNSTGKCHLCEGKGKRSTGETCPSCMGSGHCFLCAGSGKMLCPFCDDGQIYAHQHDPSSVIPIR